MLSFSPPRDRLSRAVREAQLESLLKLVPATVGVQIVTAAILVATVRDSVPNFQLGLWLGSIMLICFFRGVRAFRLRHEPDYAAQHPAKASYVCIAVAVLAMLWMAVPLFWFENFSPEAQVVTCVIFAAMLCGGSITLISLPQAALIHIGVYMISCALLTLSFSGTQLFLLSLMYGGVLTSNVLSTAAQFIAHTRDRIELREQGEIIKLLREFEASGSGGLWELDAERRFVKMSPELLEAIGRSEEVVVGLHYKRLLDPDGQISAISTGMRTLFDDIDGSLPFRDRAVPSVDRQRWWALSGKPIFDHNGQFVGYRGVASDITDSRLSGDDAVRAARTDPLTGLANRLLVRELLEEAAMSQWEGKAECALLLVDLDRFKMVNDTLGHAIGDQLLIEVARRLELTVGDGGRVGRIGGDEFAIVWVRSSDRLSLAEISNRITAELSRSFSIGAATMHIGATIGIAVSPANGQREEQLMRNADLALYRAKEAGRGGFAFFEHYMFQQAEDHRLLEQDVREALNNNGLTLAYQPIVDAQTGAIVGREALLRWRHPIRGDISPDQFIPVIEDAGLIHQIGDWVIREACAEAASWQTPLRIAVNVSAAQLSGAGLAKTVLGALAATRLSPNRLELEVTETVFLGDDAATLASLERLRSLGVRLVLDDFGQGYSSFGYLSRAHFSKIKIDQSFVRGAADGAKECIAIVNAILALARGLEVETTAEGVETERQAQVMRRLGCTQLQGYHFGRPVPAGSFDTDPGDEGVRRIA